MIKGIFAVLLLLIIIDCAYADWSLPPDVEGPSGISGGSGGIIAGSQEAVPSTSYLRLSLAIACYDEARTASDGIDYRIVMFNRTNYLDGTPVLDYEYYYPLPFIYGAGYWSSDATPLWVPNYEPGVQITLDSSNPKFVRFEGECDAFSRNEHEYYENSNLLKTYCSPTGCDPSDWDQMDPAAFSYNVDWDNDQTMCQLLGGDWLSGGDYDGWRCCVDDWIWIYNRPIDYHSRGIPERHDLESADSLCLYSSTPSYGNAIDTGDYFGGNNYYCSSQGMGHKAYDPTLSYDDDGESTFADPSKPFYFLGSGNSETDIGKWSDYYENDAMFCDMSFDSSSGAGVKFQWLTLKDAGNKNQAVCELFLGYNWTGTMCCGAPGNPESYNDPETECDGLGRGTQILNSGTPLAHITFQQQFQDLCDAYRTKNRACFENRTVENNSIAFSQDNPDIKNIFNENGELFICSGTNNVPGFTVVPKCGYKGGYDEFSICTYMNDSWHKKTESYSSDILGYRPGLYDNEDDLSASVHSSSLPSEVVNAGLFSVNTECCFSNMCWDGNECVDSASVYKLSPDNEWSELVTYEDGDQVFACRNGTWHGPIDPQYNWFYDTRYPGFCVDADQCYCTGCPAKYVDNGCTNQPNFFKDDHFCEGPGWTSRTKLLATQMMALSNGDYTLFCGDYEAAINYFQPLEPLSGRLNNFCVLNSSGTVTIGVSFNADGNDPLALDADNALLDPSSGFITTALGEDLLNCDDAIGIAGQDGYGSFRKCMAGNNKFWYNEKTQTLIYSKDGIDEAEPLPSNYDQYNSQIKTLFSTISSHIDAHTADIDKVLLNIEPFKNADDFSELYLSKTGQDTVFGVVETKYDPANKDNRNFMGISYTGVDGIDCDDITSAYDYAYCGQQGQSMIVLGRRVDTGFKYWTDLTAKLRMR